MSFITGFAIYFIIWWITLFAILPIGVRTQADEQDVTLGTAESAPLKLRMGRKLALTTIVSAAIFGVYVVMTVVFGLSVDSIPRIVPDMSSS
jgi:predicted secreted protein